MCVTVSMLFFETAKLEMIVGSNALYLAGCGCLWCGSMHGLRNVGVHEMLSFGAAFLEKTFIVYGTMWARHISHCFRRGGAAACCKLGLSLPHLKWWGRRAATATAMAYELGYRDEDVVSPLCLPQVWEMAPRAMFVDPEGVRDDIMFDNRSQRKNKPLWGRGERQRAAPTMARGKRFAGEPRSDAADLESSLDKSDSGVSAG